MLLLWRLQVQQTNAPLIEASSPGNNCSSYRGFKSSKQLLLLSRLQVQETNAPLIEASSSANKCSSYRGFSSRNQLPLLSRLQVQESTTPFIAASSPGINCSFYRFRCRLSQQLSVPVMYRCIAPGNECPVIYCFAMSRYRLVERYKYGNSLFILQCIILAESCLSSNKLLLLCSSVAESPAACVCVVLFQPLFVFMSLYCLFFDLYDLNLQFFLVACRCFHDVLLQSCRKFERRQVTVLIVFR